MVQHIMSCYPTGYRLSMGVKETPLVLEIWTILYPTKMETHKDTAENKTAKAPVALWELPPVAEFNGLELLEDISKGVQSQLME